MLDLTHQQLLVDGALNEIRNMCQQMVEIVRDGHKSIERTADVSVVTKDILDVESVQKAARAIEENPEVALSIVRRLQRENSEHRARCQGYDLNYVMPCFMWAEAVGFDLHRAVRENPGSNCVKLLVEHLQGRIKL